MVELLTLLNKKKNTQFVFFSILVLLCSCAKEKRRDQMNAQELYTQASDYSDRKKCSDAIACYEQLIARFPDDANIAEHKMALAELYFKDGRHASAQQLYDNFCQFYPADARAEYAKYRSIMSMFYQTLRSDCDQTETTETIRLCQEYLENKAFGSYRIDVQDIKISCQNRLLDKEIYVFNFYLKKHNFDAARSRLKDIKEKYADLYTHHKARIMYLECKLAHKEKNRTIEQEITSKLLQEHPTSHFTQMAQGLSRKDNFVF